MSDTDSLDLSDSDIELQEALAAGLLKPGLNVAVEAPKRFSNNPTGLRQKLEEFKSSLPWIEKLDCISLPAPLAPEMAAQLMVEENKLNNRKRNNKKLDQTPASEDPVLNDFKREMMFYRQAQSTVMECIPRLHALGVKTKRPDDYFAEMAKTDEHMQRIRRQLMQKQLQKQRSERVKELRAQKKAGKELQTRARVEKAKEKKQMLDQVKKVRKGKGGDLQFLEPHTSKGQNKGMGRRQYKDKKFGFGGKKRGLKANDRKSSGDIDNFRPNSSKKHFKGGKQHGKGKRPGKARRVQVRSKGR